MNPSAVKKGDSTVCEITEISLELINRELSNNPIVPKDKPSNP